jgi:hypothetical protein
MQLDLLAAAVPSHVLLAPIALGLALDFAWTAGRFATDWLSDRRSRR